MLGGARIVRLVVLQESKITASATAPPAPHSRLSRLPRIHRISLERHTDGEYAQKREMLTTHFFGFSCWLIGILRMPAHLAFGRTILRRRFARKSFKNAVELRERLKSSGERDFTDAQIAISQQITRGVEPSARDILDKINAGYLLEIFAQMIRVHVDRFRDFLQGELLP
jgi:hypothetical protein